MPSIFWAGLYLHREHGLGFTWARANAPVVFATQSGFCVHHGIQEVALKASVVRADHLYHLLEEENEHLLLKSTPQE